jgi:Zn-dependent peptidase ImmA (M78 family)
MSRSDPFDEAAWVADDVIADFKITTLPIDPIAIARAKGIEVLAKPVSAEGVSGMLIRKGDDYGIIYATHIESVGFQRFSVGHELGHYFLPGHIDAVLGASDFHESRAGFRSDDQYEREADYFSAALLMPRKLVAPVIRKLNPGLQAIEKVAQDCETSLTATAIRYAQLSEEPVAVVMSTGTRIEWCFMSEALKELKGIDWVRKRQLVPSGTTTGSFNMSQQNVIQARREEGSCDLQDWFGGPTRMEICEDVIGLGRYDKTLTVLHGIELPDEEQEREEEDLVDSWTPRFRR